MPGVAEGEEEEGSSSTPEKEDAEDGRPVSIVQVMDSPVKQLEVPAVVDALLELVETLPRDESLVVVEESAPEGDARDPETFRPEEEVQAIHPSGTSNRVHAFIKTLNDFSSYYERLRKKRSIPATTAPLTCEGHPFLQIFQFCPK